MDLTRIASNQPFITPSGRDLRLDFLRGFFIFQMVVDHTAEYSILYWITGGNRFFVSGAEGFLFVSGLLVGIIYYRVVTRINLGMAVTKAVHRFVDLYLIAVTSTLLVMFFSEHLHLKWATSLPMSDPLTLVIQTLTFKRAYYFADILHVYALYFLFFPIILVFLAKGQKYLILVFSLGLYIVYWISPTAASLPTVMKNYAFINFSAAQLLITIGVLIGYGPVEQNRFISKPLPRVWWIPVVLVVLTSCVLYYIYRTPSITHPFQMDRTEFNRFINVLFSKQSLGIGRLLAFLSFFIMLFHLITRYWTRFERFAGWLLLPLGRHSLYAYVFHLPIILMVAVISRITGYGHQNLWINLIISLLAVSLVLGFIYKKWIFPQPHHKRIWFAIPGIVVISFIVFETVYRIPSIYSELRMVVIQIQQFLHVFD